MRLINADMIEPHEQLEPLGNGEYEFALVVYMDDINALPSVDAAPVRRGRWIRDEFGSRCERCGLYAYRDKSGRPWESDYCPYCGADMRGERHDVI